jgi:hypothetical protein
VAEALGLLVEIHFSRSHHHPKMASTGHILEFVEISMVTEALTESEESVQTESEEQVQP